jgi:acetyl esterase/lipase
VRLSWRREYIAFTDAMADALSPQGHIGRLAAPVVVTDGTFETPEFQREARDFAAAVKAAGKPVALIEARNDHHDEMAETLGNPYGPTAARRWPPDETGRGLGECDNCNGVARCCGSLCSTLIMVVMGFSTDA